MSINASGNTDLTVHVALATGGGRGLGRAFAQALSAARSVEQLQRALKSSLPKLIVFLITVMTTVLIAGTSMHLIEGKVNPGFGSIPESVYWAIVTVTTVGFGDSVPTTVAGKLMASVLMVIGFAIIAVPTGIMTAELIHRTSREPTTQVCPECMSEGHDRDAVHCKYCGGKL